MMDKQRVILTVGCPGAGKTTFARESYPDWVVLSLDDFRSSLFRDKQVYHEQCVTKPRMRALLNDAYEDTLRTTLGYGFNAILANMHIYPNSFASTMTLLKRFDIAPEVYVFHVPLDELLRRNLSRPISDRVPEEFLRKAFADMCSPDVWWRSYDGTVRHL
jgi:predicted kinase